VLKLISSAILAVAIILSVFFIGSLFACKRRDVSWIAILVAGPIALARPDIYFQKSLQSIPQKLFVCSMTLFVIWSLIEWDMPI
jgi:hypothetical protein